MRAKAECVDTRVCTYTHLAPPLRDAASLAVRRSFGTRGLQMKALLFSLGLSNSLGSWPQKTPLLRRLPVPRLQRSQHSSIGCHGSPCTCAQRRIFSLCLICALTLFGHPPPSRHYPGFNLPVCQCRCRSRLEATSWTGTAGSDGLTQWPREHQSDELITTQHMASLNMMWQQSTVNLKCYSHITLPW